MRGTLLASLGLLGACASAPREPELFAPGTVSTAGREFATTFARDGGTVYFNVVEDGKVVVAENWERHRIETSAASDAPGIRAKASARRSSSRRKRSSSGDIAGSAGRAKR